MNYQHFEDPVRLIKVQLGEKYSKLLLEIRRAANVLGFEVFVVGGTVRDLILNVELKDIDLSIVGDAITLINEVSRNVDITVVTYPKFRTATIKTDGVEIDLVSARSEIYSMPGSLPEVIPGDITDDLKRRDFSINSMAISLNQPYEIVDPMEGLTDLECGVIKVLHSQSFTDDPTRILRMIRYASRFKFNIDTKTAEQAVNSITNNCLSTISKERLTHEIDLIFREHEPGKAVEQLIEFNILQMPAIYNQECFLELMERDHLWIALMAMYGEESYAVFAEKFSWNRKTANTVSEFVKLSSILKNLDFPNVDQNNIKMIYLILKDIPSLIMRLYVECKIDLRLAGVLEQYMLYTDGVEPSLNPVELIDLGVDKRQVSEVMDMLMIGKITGEISSKSDEISSVVQYMNG